MMSSFNFVFADNEPVFSLMPVLGSDPTYSDLSTNGFVVLQSNSKGSTYFSLDDNYDIFIGCFQNGNYINYYRLSNVSIPSTSYHFAYSWQSSVYSGTYSAWEQSNDIYYASLSSSVSGATQSNLFIFDSLNSMLSAFASWTPPSPEPTTTYKYTFQNGWLTVIDLGSSGASYDFDLSTQFNVNSGLFSKDWSPTSQEYWFSDSLPTVTSSYPAGTGTLINWERGEPRSVTGQTKYAVANLSGTSTGRYLYILNPALRKVGDEQGPSISNYAVTVSGIPYGSSPLIYEMQSNATLSGVVTKISTVTDASGNEQFANMGTATATGDNTDLTNSFVNNDSQSIVQNQGGGNANPVAQTINDYLQNVQNTLDSFTEQILNLFTAPISHIQQLISAGGNFFQVMSGLFSWLPSDISSVVVSALLIMLVIGVLKMLL